MKFLFKEFSFEDHKKDNLVEKYKVELKVLPPHLKYVVLESDDVKPLIINNALSSDEEAQLVEVP